MSKTIKRTLIQKIADMSTTAGSAGNQSSAGSSSASSSSNNNNSPTLVLGFTPSQVATLIVAVACALLVGQWTAGMQQQIFLQTSSSSSSTHSSSPPSSPHEQLGLNTNIPCREPGSGPPLPPLPIKQRVLVTGVAGFIASHVASHCVQLGLEVVGVDNLSGGFVENVPSEGVKFVQGDLRNDTFIEELFQKHGPFVHVYHLAAYAAEGMSHFIRQFNYRNNLVSSVGLINQAILSNVKTFVFTSSIAVYGAAQTPMLESTVPIPEDPYGVSKYAMELDLKAAHHMFPEMNFVIFRPHNVYGPKQNIADRYRNVIGIFLNQLLRGQPLTVFGDGTQTRCFSYIDDVAPMITAAPFVPAAQNQVFNLGEDRPSTLLELAEVVHEAMSIPAARRNIKHLAARLEVSHAQSDHGKARCVFGVPHNQTSLADGIRATVEWVKAQGEARPPVEFESVEVLKNMPESWVTDKMRENEKKKLASIPRN